MFLLSSRPILKTVLCSALLFLSVGLSAKIVVKTSAFGDYDFSGKRFYIIPADPEISAKDLEFKEYANYVSAIFKSSGAIEVTDPTTADICILMNYLITDHSYVENVPVPIRGVIGSTSTTNTTTNTYGNAYGNAYGNVYSSGSYAYGNVSGNVTANTNQTVTSTTTSTPMYGTVGYSSTQQQVNEFRRVLNIYAYDNTAEEDPDMYWKCNMVSDGYKEDLQYIIPGMAYMALGKAGEKISSEAYADDEEDWGGFKAFGNTMSSFKNASFPFQNVDANARINYVVSKRGTVEIIVREQGPSRREISSSMFLRANGTDYPLTSADHIKVGKTTRFGNDVYFYTLVFMGVPDDVQTFDIVNPGKFEWKNIRIQ